MHLIKFIKLYFDPKLKVALQHAIYLLICLAYLLIVQSILKCLEGKKAETSVNRREHLGNTTYPHGANGSKQAATLSRAQASARPGQRSSVLILHSPPNLPAYWLAGERRSNLAVPEQTQALSAFFRLLSSSNTYNWRQYQCTISTASSEQHAVYSGNFTVNSQTTAKWHLKLLDLTKLSTLFCS